MKRYFLFRNRKVFAVDSENDNLPLRAVQVSDFIFELDRFGMLYSVKDRRNERFKLFDGVKAMTKYVNQYYHGNVDISDGIPLVLIEQLPGKLEYAANDNCNWTDR